MDTGLKYATLTNDIILMKYLLAKNPIVYWCHYLALTTHREVSQFILDEINKTVPMVDGKKILMTHEVDLPLPYSQKQLEVLGLRHFSIKEKFSTLMLYLYINSVKAYYDLCAGVYTLEEINYQTESGNSALLILVGDAQIIPGAEAVLIKMLELGANVNIQDQDGYTVLAEACNNTKYFSSERIMEILLQHPEIDVNLPNDSGDTPLMIICNHIDRSSIEALEMLLNHPKVDINQQNDVGDSALMIACQNDRSNEMVPLILSKGPDLNLMGENGYTALMMASIFFNPETIDMLVACETLDCNKRNYFGENALMLVREPGGAERFVKTGKFRLVLEEDMKWLTKDLLNLYKKYCPEAMSIFSKREAPAV